ncbi:hypothetical protein QTL94_26270, partial [Rhizobium sp. S96]|nr:hypothetical protein [Rhizobium sp. S96]
SRAPAENMRGTVETWVNSRWKYRAAPGQLSVEINTEDDLFPECPPVAADKPQERSMPAVKAFTYYRRSAGVTDAVEGKRRDRVNFHSFRRWFVTKAIQAGQAELTVQIVVGHKPQSVAASVYLGGLTMEQMAECVEAVKLP